MKNEQKTVNYIFSHTKVIPYNFRNDYLRLCVYTASGLAEQTFPQIAPLYDADGRIFFLDKKTRN